MKTTIPTPMKIRFLVMRPCHKTSLKLLGISNGLRKIFHWVRSMASCIIISATPIRTMTTAVPFPFLIRVENMNAMDPMKTMGYINW